MSRKIDTSKKLSEADIAYIQQRQPWMKLPEGVEAKAERVATVTSEDGATIRTEETDGTNTRQIEGEPNTEESTDSTPSGQDDTDNGDRGYEDMSKDELKDECRERELPVGGNREELIARLNEDDEADLIEDDEE